MQSKSAKIRPIRVELGGKVVPEKLLRLRWERETRYYEVHLHQDLWGGWVVTRVWGRRGTALGQLRRAPCASYAEALERLAAITRQRERRGYERR